MNQTHLQPTLHFMQAVSKRNGLNVSGPRGFVSQQFKLLLLNFSSSNYFEKNVLLSRHFQVHNTAPKRF